VFESMQKDGCFLGASTDMQWKSSLTSRKVLIVPGGLAGMQEL
jgi:hypothetical protein